MTAEILVRPAGVEDVPDLERVMLASDDAPPGSQLDYLAHLVRRGVTAVALADAVVVGFGACVDTPRSRHLADLFVLPDWQGRGIGGRLLQTVFAGAPVRTTFASDDPRALPLYVRAGMTALWPNLYIAGDPARLPSGAADCVAVAATFEEMADYERQWIPTDRLLELPYWQLTVDPRPFVVLAAGRPVAAGFGRGRKAGRGRWLDHAVVAPDADPAPALLAALRFGLAGAEVGGACVPGPSSFVRVLLEAGFRIGDRDTFLGSDSALVDPAREIVNTGFL